MAASRAGAALPLSAALVASALSMNQSRAARGLRPPPLRPQPPRRPLLNATRATGSAAEPAQRQLPPPMLYGTAWKKQATTDLVVLAVRSGFRGIDTACQPKHYQEELVGQALERLAQEDGIAREDLWVQTKFTPVPGQDRSNIPYNASAPLTVQVEQSIARSLENLGTTYIDSLVLHSPLPTLQATLEAWGVFERAVDDGRVRQLGISNCYDERFFRALHESARIKPAVLQNRFYAESGYDVGLRRFCLEQGIAYQTFWTLTANRRLLESAPVQSAARRLRATPPQVLFRWLIQSGHQPLTGTKSPEHMRQDLDAASLAQLELSAEEMVSIGQLVS